MKTTEVKIGNRVIGGGNPILIQSMTNTKTQNVEATVEVINVAGQVVFSQDVEGSATINKALAAGVYTVVVKSNGAVSTQKLIVK